MSRLFGWSYPPGCSGTPYDVDVQPNPSGNARDRRKARRTTYARCTRHGCLKKGGECQKCNVEQAAIDAVPVDWESLWEN